MEFEEMCLKAGMKKEDAHELADCVEAMNNADMLLMLYFAEGMKKGKEAAEEMRRLESERRKRKERKKKE